MGYIQPGILVPMLVLLHLITCRPSPQKDHKKVIKLIIKMFKYFFPYNRCKYTKLYCSKPVSLAIYLCWNVLLTRWSASSSLLGLGGCSDHAALSGTYLIIQVQILVSLTTLVFCTAVYPCILADWIPSVGAIIFRVCRDVCTICGCNQNKDGRVAWGAY